MTDVRLELQLKAHQVEVKSDNAFQRRARLLQALWRAEQGLPIGEHRGGALGSRLAMPAAKRELLNYITDPIREVVRREVLDPKISKGKLYGQPRIFNDLLSSQPLCFNLFGELQGDVELASRTLRILTHGRVQRVTAVQFEHSPGRGDLKYTGDRSAFDVYVEFVNQAGAKGFLGIEVKYHEDLGDRPAPHRARYDELAAAMGCFKSEANERLRKKPLQQIWRDHLLAGALRLDKDSGFEDGMFVFLFPRDNARCSQAVEAYKACLGEQGSFAAWTLEDVVAAITQAGAGAWIRAFEDRYLNFGKLGFEA